MLQVDRVDLHYGAAIALRQVSIAAEPGRITALLGRNGVGKTSLLRAITGAHPISRGSIRWEGAEIGSLPIYERARRGIAWVPQGRDIFPLLSVRENLETGFAVLPRRQRRAVRTRFSSCSRCCGRCCGGAAAICRADSSSSWRSPARWSCGRACSCSTSRPRASSRASSRKSRGSSGCCASAAGWPFCLSSNISTSRAIWRIGSR